MPSPSATFPPAPLPLRRNAGSLRPPDHALGRETSRGGPAPRRAGPSFPARVGGRPRAEALNQRRGYARRRPRGGVGGTRRARRVRRFRPWVCRPRASTPRDVGMTSMTAESRRIGADAFGPFPPRTASAQHGSICGTNWLPCWDGRPTFSPGGTRNRAGVGPQSASIQPIGGRSDRPAAGSPLRFAIWSASCGGGRIGDSGAQLSPYRKDHVGKRAIQRCRRSPRTRVRKPCDTAPECRIRTCTLVVNTNTTASPDRSRNHLLALAPTNQQPFPPTRPAVSPWGRFPADHRQPRQPSSSGPRLSP